MKIALRVVTGGLDMPEYHEERISKEINSLEDLLSLLQQGGSLIIRKEDDQILIHSYDDKNYYE